MKTPTGRLFPAQLAVLCAVLLCLLPLSTAQAASGTCNARYEVVVTHVNGMPMNKVIRFGEFQSHGRGRMSVRAAGRAKQNAEQCMQSHWQGRGNGVIPYACQDQLRISGYHIQDFEETLQQEICDELKPLHCDRGSAQISYSLFATVDGEQGCGIGTSTVSRTLLASGLTSQCECRDNRRDRDRGRGHGWGHGPHRQLSAPQQISPAQGTTFYHFPRRTQVSWRPVQRAASYLVEVKYNGRQWTTLVTTGEATFGTFDFPGAGQGEWRVTAQSQGGRQGTPSPWYSFSYQR